MHSFLTDIAVTITKETLQKIASLAKLQLSEDDLEKLPHELSSIFSLVEKISQIDTVNVDPLAHPLEITQPLRADVIHQDIDVDTLESLAPNFEDSLYIVPKVID